MDRLVSVNRQNSDVAYQYDPLGRRIKRTTSHEAEWILYDGGQELAIYSTDGTLKALRVPGIESPAAIELEGKPYAPIIDAHGHLIELIDPETKQTTHRYAYSAFGELLTAQETTFNPWRYACKHRDLETRLIDFGRRIYNPKTARFLTKDPAGAACSFNPYQYCYNNPCKYCDPDGRFVFIIALPFAAVTLETVLTTAIAATAAYCVYEAAPYIENWVNEGYFNPPIVNAYNTWKKRKQSTGEPKYTWEDLGDDAQEPKIEGLEWKGRGLPGSSIGAWHNPETGENFHPDFDHGDPYGPHWDYVPDKDYKGYRLFPDNSWDFK